MTRKIKYSRPELKKQRELLARTERYLPMLKLKQRLLQQALREVSLKEQRVENAAQAKQSAINKVKHLWTEPSGAHLSSLATPTEVLTTTHQVAGIDMDVLYDLRFSKIDYSHYFTPDWLDSAVASLRELSALEAELELLRRQHEILSLALVKANQRLNLFEKIIIPQTMANIKRIRISLGDEQTVAVIRSKLAKKKITERSWAQV